MNRSDGTALQFDLFHLAPGVDLLYRDGEVVPLEPRAVRVLRYLAEHHDRVLSKEELLEEVWSDVFTTEGVLKKAVSQIRRALGDDAEQSRFVATYHGRGYRFIAPVARRPLAQGPRQLPKQAGAPASLVPNYDQLAARGAEMLRLRAELHGALEGTPRPVLIVGESGIGKTQLVRHFRRSAIEQGALSLYGRFFDYRGARLAPYELFIDLLRSAIGNGRAETRAAHGTALRDAIEESSGIRLPSELFEDSSRTESSVGAGSVGDHFRFVVPICRAWLALSCKQPIVITFDDLQWADLASLDVLGCLMRMLESEPLMLIMIVRSDEVENPELPIRAWLEEHATRRAYTTLRLGRLDVSECREVIGSIFQTCRGGEIPRHDIERLHRLTDGNPYFLVETLRLLAGADAIVADASKQCWEWKGMRDLALPETIVTAARAKIERLPERIRIVVEQAAVIGEEFLIATLCRLSGLEEIEVEQVLSEAVRRGVLSIQGLTPGEDCRFQHSILRHVVYDAIPPHRRRALHARAAEAIEAVYGSESDRVAEALASHYAAARDARRSFEAGMRAWRTATSRSEWRKAVVLIERAEEVSRGLSLSHAERMDLLLALGETWRAVGRIREAASVTDRAVDLASLAGDGVVLGHALLLRGIAEIALSHYVEARASLAQALDQFLENGKEQAVSRTLVQLAVVEAAVGHYDRAALLVEELRANDPAADIAALADGIVGWSLALRGRYAEGALLLERALAYHDRMGEIRERAQLLRRLQWTCLARGDTSAAIALALRAHADSATIDDVSGQAKANMGLGQAYLARGVHDEAVSFLNRAIEQLRTIGDAHCEAECIWLLGRARYEMGAFDESASLLARALTMIRHIGDRDDEFRILTDLARLNILRANLDLAEKYARAAHTLAEALDNAEGSALTRLELAKIERARGNTTSATEIARSATLVLERMQSSERWRAAGVATQESSIV